MYRTTYQDAIDHLLDFSGAGAADQVLRDCRRSIIAAYRELTDAHNWTYLHKHGRLIVAGPYTTGTITYSLTTNLVTLVGGVWPSNAASCYIRIGTVNARVASRIDDVTLALDATLHPASDFPSGTTYSLYQDGYLLPEDFTASGRPMYEWNFGGLEYIHPSEWMHQQRYTYQLGTPSAYTIIGSQSVPGRLEAKLTPIPQQARTIDFDYKRRPRALSLQLRTGGTVSASDTAVTGVGTQFAPDDVGRILRVGATASPPTSLVAGTPFVFESVVTASTSPVSLVVQDAPPSAYGGVGYTISDMIDIEPGSMTNVFLKGCEHQMAMARSFKDRPNVLGQYREALVKAKEADSRSFAGRAEGRYASYRQPITKMPLGPDMGVS